MTRLNELRDNPGSSKTRMRIGRGIGSSKGKTGGRGGKGQTARSGVAINGFEGDRIQDAIDAGRLDHKGVIDSAALVAAGVIRRPLDGVRLIAGAKEFKAKKVTFNVYHASAGVIAAIEALGGKIDMPEAKEKADA
jgi:large subunit ribosomal protein L15